ncbi:MAG: hypothetical protein ABIR57_15350 [Aeromicrobium sp.]
MSIRALTQLVVTERPMIVEGGDGDDANLAGDADESPAPQPPIAADVLAEKPDPDVKTPTLGELLTQTLSPPLVGAYSALIAVITVTVAAPTVTDLHPNQHVGWRWVCLATLVVFSGVLTALSVREKTEKAKAKMKSKFIAPLAVLSVVLTSTAWGLGLPESPILVGADKSNGLITIAFVGFVGIGLNVIIAKFLGEEIKKEANQP